MHLDEAAGLVDDAGPAADTDLQDAAADSRNACLEGAAADIEHGRVAGAARAAGMGSPTFTGAAPPVGPPSPLPPWTNEPPVMLKAAPRPGRRSAAVAQGHRLAVAEGNRAAETDTPPRVSAALGATLSVPPATATLPAKLLAIIEPPAASRIVPLPESGLAVSITPGAATSKVPPLMRWRRCRRPRGDLQQAAVDGRDAGVGVAAGEDLRAGTVGGHGNLAGAIADHAAEGLAPAGARVSVTAPVPLVVTVPPLPAHRPAKRWSGSRCQVEGCAAGKLHGRLPGRQPPTTI